MHGRENHASGVTHIVLLADKVLFFSAKTGYEVSHGRSVCLYMYMHGGENYVSGGSHIRQFADRNSSVCVIEKLEVAWTQGMIDI